MATIKLKKPDGRVPTGPAGPANIAPRAPVRGAGAGVKARPTLAQAQALRVESEARYQAQLRQRFGERAPPAFARRDAGPPRSRDATPPPRRDAAPMNPSQARRQDRQDPPHSPRSPHPPHSPRSSSERLQGQPRQLQQPLRQPPPRQPPQHPEWPDREPQDHLPGSMRLSKRMSELGIASRREADEWIAQGWVRVDDQVVKELGSRVVPGQRVTVDAKAKYQQAQRVTVLINKPVGYVSGQAEDGYEPAVVLVTPQNQWHEDHSGTRFLREHLRSLVPAGRLDIDSVGLLVLTQDGRVAKQLIGEDSEIEKEYLVRVATAGGIKLADSSLALLRHGLELDAEALLPAQVEWVNADQLRFVLRQGKKRQIRRMCEAVGLQVLGLKRVRIGSVMLGDLPAGQWRYLRMDEGFAAV